MAKAVKRSLVLKEISLNKLKMRRFYRNNFINFAHDILGNKDVCKDTHGEYCWRLQQAYFGRDQMVSRKGIHRYMSLLPRKSLKTVLGSVCGPIWMLYQNDPIEGQDYDQVQWEAPPSFNGKPGFDQRINLNHETDDFAARYLDNVVRQIRYNDAFNRLFGEVGNVFWTKKTEGKWSGWEVNIPWRRDLIAKEANLTTGSLRGSSAGGHYDWIVFDDIFTEVTVEQEGGTARTKVFYKNFSLIADNPCVLWLNGTIYRDDDLYTWIMETEAHKWNIQKERARWESEEAAAAAGKSRLFFPAKLDDEVLDDLLETLGPVTFGRQMQNDPVADDTQKFKPHYFEIYPIRSDREWLKTGFTVTTADPKIFDPDAQKYIEGKNECEATIMTCLWTPGPHVWTLDYFAKKDLTPGEFLDEFFRQCMEWESLYAGFEEVAYQKTLRFDYEVKCIEHKYYPNYIPLKPGHRSKPQRIVGLEPRARRGQIHIRAGHEDLKTQFIRFPFGKTVDGIDVFAYQLDLAHVMIDKEKPAEVVQTESQLIEEHFQRKLKAAGVGRFTGRGTDLNWMDG